MRSESVASRQCAIGKREFSETKPDNSWIPDSIGLLRRLDLALHTEARRKAYQEEAVWPFVWLGLLTTNPPEAHVRVERK